MSQSPSFAGTMAESVRMGQLHWQGRLEKKKWLIRTIRVYDLGQWDTCFGTTALFW